MKISKSKGIVITALILGLVAIKNINVFATDFSHPFPQLDAYKNQTDYSYNGSGVEYNGVKVGNNVWCKPGDILGVTSWAKIYNPLSANYDYICNGYLSLGNTNSRSRYFIQHDNGNETTPNVDQYTIDSATSDISVVGSQRGIVPSANGYARTGSLFWLKPLENNRNYTIRSNAYAYNTNWYLDDNNVDNWPASPEHILTDGNAPSVSISPNGYGWTNSSVTVNFSVSDSQSGIQDFQYVWRKIGSYDWQYSQWFYPTYHSNINGPMTRTWTDKLVLPSITNNMSASLNLTDEGQYQVGIIAYDNVGNCTGYVYSNYIYIDKSPPTPPGIYGNRTGWGTDNLVYTIGNSTDSLSGVNHYEYSFDNVNWNYYSGAITISNEGWGNPVIYARAIDNVGNVSGVSACAYGIDRTPPTTPQIWANRTGWGTDNLVYNIGNSTDTYSGVNHYEYSFDNTNWNYYSGAITISNEGWGNPVIYARAIDNVGNVSSVNACAYGIDRTPPAISVNPTSGGWTNNSLNVTITASDIYSGVKSIYYSWSTSNSVTPSSWISYQGTSTTTSQNSQGIWYLWYYAEDNVGNQSPPAYAGTYKIDTTAPSGTFTPNSQSWTNVNVTTSFSPMDLGGSGVKQWRYKTSSDNGTTWGTWSSYTLGSTVGNITLSGQGQWQVQAEITDNAGNINTVTSGAYQIDTTVPGGTFTPNSQSWTNVNVTTSFSPMDLGGAGVKQWRYKTSSDNGTTWGAWSNYTLGSTAGNITLSSEGQWKVQAEVTDNAGNINIVTSDTYQIDKTVPTCNATPSNGDYLTNTPNIALTYSDNLSGVAISQYQWANTTTPGTTWNNYSGPIVQSAIGTWYLHYKVVDNAGNTSTGYFGPYKVWPVNTPPAAAFTVTPNPQLSGSALTYTDTSSTNDAWDSWSSKTWNYRASTDGGSTWSSWQSSELASPPGSFSVTVQTLYEIRLTVTDTGNMLSGPLTNSTTRQVTIYPINHKPVVAFTVTPNPQFISYPLNYNLTYDPSDSWDSITKIEWSYSLDEGNTWSAVTSTPQISFNVPGIYRVRVRVQDRGNILSPALWSDYYYQDITISDLTVTGQVKHTDRWDSNRKNYNKAQSGNEESPRTYDVFFPGEMFELSAATVQGANASRVNVQLQGTTFNVDLTSTDGANWTGELWDESMIDWNDRTLTFTFTAYYQNGVIKTNNVTVKIVKDDYWRQHRNF